MSLVGIDVGSSSVKIAAYQDDGKLLALVSHELTPLHPQPGWWEQDAEEIWQATSRGMQELMADGALRSDPPRVIGVSASGRENFLADADGRPLANGVMGADVRGAEFEQVPTGDPIPEPWTLSCGHLRERMDPLFRYRWWAKYHPELVEKARYFLGWHDFLTLRISGRDVTDRSQAGRWAIWDLARADWDPERVAEFGVNPDLLPEVLPWGELIGDVKPDVAAAWGLPPGVKLANGSMDLNCCALGIGVSALGTACMVSGSYENLLIPTANPPSASMLLRGLSVTPHPSETGLSIFAICPTGSAILNWARDRLNLTVEEVNQQLREADRGPSPITAVPYLSGSMMYWEDGRKARGALLGITLATTGLDIVRAFMESIAYDHVNTLSLLAEEGVPVNGFRATGGGTRSDWWTQLKADMTNKPIEVIDQPEPGTLGAALLAGQAIGLIDDVGAAARAYAKVSAVYEPEPARAALHQERLEYYRKTMRTLLRELY
jgi:xylulokinase